MIGLLLALSLTQSSCAAPQGMSALLDADQRFIVVGETHGTAETPAVFATMVCEAAVRGPVTVALELPQGMQPELDAFLIAATDAAALTALEGTPFLDPTMVDGRTSVAMVEMMNAVRRLKAEGRDVAILAFQPSSEIPAELPQSHYEIEMGYLLSRAASDRPRSKVLALVGSLHASKTRIPGYAHIGLPATAHLPADDTLSLLVAQQGGEAWNCSPNCGINPVRSRYDTEARGLTLGAYADGAYDAVLALGPSTASPPFTAQGD